MKPIYKSLALAAMTLQVSLALNAVTRDDENTSTMALQADLLDSLRVELVALNVSGSRNLIESGECVIEGSNLTITLDTSGWTRGAMYRVQVLATFGTQTQVIYALNVTVPYYAALSDETQEFEDNVTIVSTITDVTEADLEGLALEATSQEIKAAIIPISVAAEAYNVGKTKLAAAITSKGVETSPTETYPEMAEKVNAIAQETYEIDGGEMYAKQLFGSMETPNYWNLYEVLADLLTDGNVPEWNEDEQTGYGGIMLAQYYKGYASFAFDSSCSAGAGGGYVFSDDYTKWKNGEISTLPIQTTDTEHFWDDDNDGKGDRWIAFLFAGESHGFTIADTNRCPRAIFIGRKVGAITSSVNGRVSDVVVIDGNELSDFYGDRTQNWGKSIVIRNISHSTGVMLYGANNTESIYIEANQISSIIWKPSDNNPKLSSCVIRADRLTGIMFDSVYQRPDNSFNTLVISCPYINAAIQGYATWANFMHSFKTIVVTTETCQLEGNNDRSGGFASADIYINYIENDKTKGVGFSVGYGTPTAFSGVTKVVLKSDWCKPLNISVFTGLTKENVQTYIFDRLGVNDLSTGAVTIKLANAVLNLFTQEEIDAVVERTNITIVGA